MVIDRTVRLGITETEVRMMMKEFQWRGLGGMISVLVCVVIRVLAKLRFNLTLSGRVNVFIKPGK